MDHKDVGQHALDVKNARTAALREVAEWMRTNLPNSLRDFRAATMLDAMGVSLTPEEKSDLVPF